LIVGFLTLFVGFFFGLVVFPYLRAYAAKRGENLATHDDMDKLERQVAAITRITEEIKTEISTGLWDRQRRWYMKREVIFQAAKRLSEVDDALLASSVVLKADLVKQAEWKLEAPTPAEQLGWSEIKSERMMRWMKASTEFDESREFVTIVCGKEAVNEFQALGAFINNLAAEMTADPNKYDIARPEMMRRILLTQMKMRKDLEVDARSQSNVSSAAPTPAPRSPEAKS
jgi:hypothetical protein